MIHCKHLTNLYSCHVPYVGLELNKINIFVITRCEVFLSSVTKPFCSTVSDCFPEIPRVISVIVFSFVSCLRLSCDIEFEKGDLMLRSASEPLHYLNAEKKRYILVFLHFSLLW